MLFKKYKLILHLFYLVIPTYLLHSFCFVFFKIDSQNFYYSLETLYVIFSGFASLLLWVITKLEKDKFDSIGMFYMLGTFIQMFLAYFIMRPILSDKVRDITLEKTNFFGVFILFLLFETLLTARLLNKKR